MGDRFTSPEKKSLKESLGETRVLTLTIILTITLTLTLTLILTLTLTLTLTIGERATMRVLERTEREKLLLEVNLPQTTHKP